MDAALTLHCLLHRLADELQPEAEGCRALPRRGSASFLIIFYRDGASGDYATNRTNIIPRWEYPV